MVDRSTVIIFWRDVFVSVTPSNCIPFYIYLLLFQTQIRSYALDAGRRPGSLWARRKSWKRLPGWEPPERLETEVGEESATSAGSSSGHASAIAHTNRARALNREMTLYLNIHPWLTIVEPHLLEVSEVTEFHVPGNRDALNASCVHF